MANVKKYSVKKDGEQMLTKNFAVREFRSPDSDTVYIDLDNVKQLQKLRDYFNKPMHINSGYRSAAHNAKVGGAKKSLHMDGKAADVVISGIPALKVAMRAEIMGFNGVLWYPNKLFTHIDTREKPFHAIYLSSEVYYPEPTGTLRSGAKGSNVKWLQYMLNRIGYKLTVDGSYGPATMLAVKDFQRKCELTVDAVFGTKTLQKLREVLAE